MDKILVIAAHPDDDVLGCGGMLAKFSETKQFRIIFIAEGTSCRYSGDFSDTDLILAKITERTQDSLTALRMLGITDVQFYDLPCGRLDTQAIIDINKIIEREISDYKPDTVLTHSEYDINNDHRLVFRSVMMATRPGAFEGLNHVFSFEVQSSTEWNFNDVFQPSYFEVINKSQLEKKWEAISCFTSEVRPYPHPRSFEGVQALAMYRGMQAGSHYAEAYRIVRSVNR